MVGVKDVSFAIAPGETLCVVGESGSGKSVTALSTVALLPDSAQISGSVTYSGTQMIGAPEPALRRIRGNDISFIFQEPMTSLNPLHSIERQICESLALHQGLEGEAARTRALTLLEKVGIRNAADRLAAYPHQLSGGQRQRFTRLQRETRCQLLAELANLVEGEPGRGATRKPVALGMDEQLAGSVGVGLEAQLKHGGVDEGQRRRL